MEKRTECYICNPIYFDLYCTKCGGNNIEWSEYEKHIWCYDCEEDIEYEHGAVLVCDEAAQMLGIDYRRYNIETGKIIER